MAFIKYIYNKRIVYSLPIIFIGMLTVGIIVFRNRDTMNQLSVKQRVAMCEYMGIELFTGIKDSPDFGQLPKKYTTKYPKIKTPDVAVNVGIAILSSLYGKRVSEMQKPYKVSLINGEVWDVSGSLPYKDFHIMIQRSDCRILSIGGYSYIEYVKEKGVSKVNKGMMDIMDDVASIWMYKGNTLLSDFINNDVHVPHSPITYIYQGEKQEDRLPFVRLPFKSYINSEGKEVFPNIYEWMPDNGYTPDSTVCNLPDGVLRDYETAAKVGIAILSSIYGYEEIKKQCPFDVYFGNTGYWVLDGRLPSEFTAGGTAHIIIQKVDSRIIFYYHEK